MITGFKHKGLKELFEKGKKSKLPANHVEKINDQLTALHTAAVIDDMDIPGWALHPLKHNLKGQWAVSVYANWRIVFKFENGNAEVVDFLDYHGK